MRQPTPGFPGTLGGVGSPPGSGGRWRGAPCGQVLRSEWETEKQSYLPLLQLPRWLGGKEPACQCRRHKRRGFSPWVGKIPWRRAWQPTPVFLPGESRGPRSLAGYSRLIGSTLRRASESDRAEVASHAVKRRRSRRSTRPACTHGKARAAPQSLLTRRIRTGPGASDGSRGESVLGLSRLRTSLPKLVLGHHPCFIFRITLLCRPLFGERQ